MQELYREYIKDIGWVALVQLQDGRICLRIKGEWVFEQPKKPRKIGKLKIVTKLEQK